jgi:hypothetical protein
LLLKMDTGAQTSVTGACSLRSNHPNSEAAETVSLPKLLADVLGQNHPLSCRGAVFAVTFGMAGDRQEGGSVAGILIIGRARNRPAIIDVAASG